MRAEFPDVPEKLRGRRRKRRKRNLKASCFSNKCSKKSQDYKSLLFLSQPLMVNIQNLGLIESVGVKFKEGICAKLCLKLWFESDWYYFCKITQLGWFWKRLSRKKILNNHFLKSLQKQPYADVLQNWCS